MVFQYSLSLSLIITEIVILHYFSGELLISSSKIKFSEFYFTIKSESLGFFQCDASECQANEKKTRMTTCMIEKRIIMLMLSLVDGKTSDLL